MVTKLGKGRMQRSNSQWQGESVHIRSSEKRSTVGKIYIDGESDTTQKHDMTDGETEKSKEVNIMREMGPPKQAHNLVSVLYGNHSLEEEPE